jgi:hypothetical protein
MKRILFLFVILVSSFAIYCMPPPTMVDEDQTTNLTAFENAYQNPANQVNVWTQPERTENFSYFAGNTTEIKISNVQAFQVGDLSLETDWKLNALQELNGLNNIMADQKNENNYFHTRV